MPYFLITVIIIIFIWMIFGNRIKAWLRNLMMRKMEDAIRARMGMPSRKEEKRRRKQERRGAPKTSYSRHSYHPEPDDGPLIPKEYAEDVEFVEYKEFSDTEIRKEYTDGAKCNKERTFVAEHQVEDAEYTEIKFPK